MAPFRPHHKEERSRLRDTLGDAARSLSRGTLPLEPSVEDRIRGLGFSGESARAFDLLPLVLVAWADGSVQAEERAAILEVLRVRGLAEGSTYTMFEALLEERPADVYLDTAVELLRDLLAERGIDGAGVVDLCIEIAAAASHIVGADPISPEERDAIGHVADVLGDTAVAELHRRLG